MSEAVVHNEDCGPRWYRWTGYFRGEHTETKWHFANDPHDEKALCGIELKAWLAAWKDAPKLSLCQHCKSMKEAR